MAAQVVLPALEQGDAGPQPGDDLDGVGGQGRVPGQHLPLEGERRRGDDGALPGVEDVDHDGDEVAERLAGAGAGLHQQVAAGLQRAGHAIGHLDLPGARGAAEAAHGLVEGRPGAPAVLARGRGRRGG